MAYSIIDLSFSQGEDFSQTMTLNEDIGLSDITCKLTDSALVSKDITVVINDSSIGQFTLSLTNAQTSLLSEGVGLWQCKKTEAGRDEYIIKGRIYIDGEL